jgi:1-aminocyclopropane-1-carboxylate deaminase/D-cysteine desulfhydrase-like pyridoxal-dependent ACC family enzyme
MKYIKQQAIIELSENFSVLMLDALPGDTHGAGNRGLGNKFYKLLPNFEEAKRQGHVTLVSFGGAWSNHIHALAKLGSEQGFKTVGVIRGERPPVLSAMLEDAGAWGMQLEFVSRQAYREKDSPALIKTLEDKHGAFYLIPEGGSNAFAVHGCRQIVDDLNTHARDYDLLVLPVGTGGTMAGVVAGLAGNSEVLGICVLKDGEGSDFLNEQVNSLLLEVSCTHQNWSINPDFHCGGYARFPDYLRDFVAAFEATTKIELDPVYTAKMMYAIDQLRKAGLIKSETKVVAIHTGGLQGKRGFQKH